MTIDVIILAQGTQQRMGPGMGYKQLLPLASCGDVPLLVRTLRQLGSPPLSWMGLEVTVVTWEALGSALALESRLGPTDAQNGPGPPFTIRCLELPAPGNSSLRGVARYLEHRGAPQSGATVVLLGDVLYSWDCLQSLFRYTLGSYGFVGSGNLSSSGGELWGVAWNHLHDDAMMRELADALLLHPPFEDDYQPGQLRRWIMGFRRGELADRVARLTHAGTYAAIDDYTMDVDLPQHISQLANASVAAAADDFAHGVTWW